MAALVILVVVPTSVAILFGGIMFYRGVRLQGKIMEDVCKYLELKRLGRL